MHGLKSKELLSIQNQFNQYEYNLELRIKQFAIFMSKANPKLQIYKERMNPQFIGISDRYNEQKKKRKEIQLQKLSIDNNVKHLSKVHENLEMSLTRKSVELNYLKNVRQRYLNDIQRKMERETHHNNNLDKLRQFCMQSRTNSIRNIEYARNTLHQKKHKATNEVKNQLSRLKGDYSIKKSRIDAYHQNLFETVQNMKAEGKERINKFYRKKNKALLNIYRSMIHKEQFLRQKSTEEIHELTQKKQKYKEKISKKDKKLNQILQQIQELKHFQGVHKYKSNKTSEVNSNEQYQTADSQKMRLLNIPSEQAI